MGSMKMKRIIAVISMLVMLSISVGCGADKKVTSKEYDNLKENVTLGCGLTVGEMEQIMIDFSHKVYAPRDQDDIKEGVDLLKEYLTSEEYTSLNSGVSEYKQGIKTELSDITVRICKGDYSNDGMDRVEVDFKIKYAEYNKGMLLEFVINPNNKIFKHYIWANNI